MGIALWIAAGCLASASTRPAGMGRTGWAWELVAAIGAALALGVVATAFDFGGWNETDWRAGVFALCGAFAAVAGVRLAVMTRRHVSPSASDESAAR